MKICKNCKWYSDNYSRECNKNLGIDPVSGGIKVPYLRPCELHRKYKGWFNNWLNDICGESGRWFEPKEKL